MIQLARHIEVLLLENDCVVIPGFGGFIAHNMSAVWNKEENLFIPPTRVIGFNPQLKMNDGLLVQSYMKTYLIDYEDANKIVQKEVNRVIHKLNKEGKVEFPFIGEIHYSANELYAFSSYDNKLTSPSYYGLNPFKIKDLYSLTKEREEKEIVDVPARRFTSIPISPIWRNVAAVVAAVILFFFMSTPIENTYIENENYAHILPTELFDKIKTESLITSLVPSTFSGKKVQEVTVDVVGVDEEPEVKPVEAKEVKVAKPEVEKTVETVAATPKELKFHLIIASVTKEEEGNRMIEKLQSKGYSGAKVITGDGRIRVSIASYSTREEATEQLLQLRKTSSYESAWLLTR